LVFEREFEISHDWKHGSVFISGYQVDATDGEDYSDSEDDEEEEEARMFLENVTASQFVKPETTKASDSKPKDDDDDDSDEDEDEDSDDVEELSDSSDDEELEDADGSSDDEMTPEVGVGKKRVNESAKKTPVSTKKAKLASPQKSGGKKGAHTATPYPSKQAGKASATSTKSKDQTPKSGGLICKSCSKTFNSDGALQSHTKAKHSAK